jgi:cytochrome P450
VTLVDGFLPPKYEPLDFGSVEDPYPIYAELRRAQALCRGGAGLWVVTRYEDVARLLDDSRLSHEFPEEYHRFSVGDGGTKAFFQRILLDRDPPAHTLLRDLMTPAFTPAAVRRLRGRIGDLVDRLLEPALDRHRFDAVNDLAFPLSVTVVCELIGIPAADQGEVRPRIVDLASAFGTYTVEPDRRRADQAIRWLREYVRSLMATRRQSAAQDVMSEMMHACAHQRALDPEAMVDNLVFLFLAGFETTMNLISTGCDALVRHLDQFRRLENDPALVGSAVEEFLRFDAPIQNVARLVREDLELAGRRIRKGRVLVLLLGSANRDERKFADPDRLDIGRKPNPHVSFGGGRHYCLGANLARLEASIVFERLVVRCRTLARAGKPVRRSSTTFRSFESVPLAVSPR